MSLETPTPQLISEIRFRRVWSHSLSRTHQQAFLARVGPRFTGEVVELGGERHFDHARFFPQASGFLVTNIARDHDLEVDITAMPWPDASQDGFVCVSVLEHMDDPDQALAEMRRCLRPGGLLALSVPFLYPVHDVVDWWRPTPAKLLALVEDGFEVEEMYHLGGRIASVIGLLQKRGTSKRGLTLRLVGQLMALFGRFEQLDAAPNGVALLVRRTDSTA